MNPLIFSAGTGLVTQVVANIGITALISSISSINKTSQNIYNLVKDLSLNNTDHCANINTSLTELDLETTIKIINEILKTVNENKITSKSILLSIQSIKTIVFNIESELIKLQNTIKYNDSLWVFKKFRSYDCSKSLKLLNSYKLILDNRKKLLSEILQINFYLEQNLNDNTIEKQDLTNITINDKQTIISENYYNDLL